MLKLNNDMSAITTNAVATLQLEEKQKEVMAKMLQKGIDAGVKAVVPFTVEPFNAESIIDEMAVTNLKAAVEAAQGKVDAIESEIVRVVNQLNTDLQNETDIINKARVNPAIFDPATAVNAKHNIGMYISGYNSKINMIMEVGNELIGKLTVQRSDALFSLTQAKMLADFAGK